ncbi:MAG: undecaprenyl/decaprenyl-phosphate alpha-N-acetylglucosaminyl 1-phosphate transferase [Bacteroidales bacterium]|jgi:UDP-N-acetylmuramyl pentapeptide phosphotransferase/UDP-N-acetylglucosamine-1-phosphate transferase|nr:undecaprenyl/decaprenyl-phosphate alpha-N-acetylglucosaminyl 1-phosphate transferase [Bacteroidales bacterium]
MIYIIFSFISALTISFLFMPLLITILNRNQLFDQGGKRKIHKGRIPSMGGIVILLAFTLSLIAWMPYNQVFEKSYLLGAIALVALLGIRDDFVPIVPKQKLIVQLIAASIVVFLADTQITSLYGFMGIEAIPEWLGCMLSVVFIIFITNAFNLIDGIDGLAGTTGIISLCFMGVWFYFADNLPYSITAFTLAGGIAGFLYYNWYPATIFMGDTGSLVIGFVLSTCGIWLLNTNATLPGTSILHFDAPISMVCGILLFPVFDTIRVFILRLYQGVSPFRADKQHTHHKALRILNSHSRVTVIISITHAVVLVIITVLATVMSDNMVMPVIIIFCLLTNRFINKRFIRFFHNRAKHNAR